MEWKSPRDYLQRKYKQTVDSAYWIKIRFVTNPSLQVYPAPADNNTGTVVVVCPGGSYYGLSFINEGIKVAEWLNSLGISAFVLHYRLPNDATKENPDPNYLEASDVKYLKQWVRKGGVLLPLSLIRASIVRLPHPLRFVISIRATIIIFIFL